MKKLKVKIYIEEGGLPPQKGKEGDAGLDVFAHLPNGFLSVSQGESAKIPLGFRYSFWEGHEYVTSMDPFTTHISNWEISHDYYFEIRNRSGVGLRSGFTELASICDASYRGVPHYCVAKVTSGNYIIHHHDKIAQMLIHPFVNPHRIDIEIVQTIEELGETTRGSSGFGASGT